MIDKPSKKSTVVIDIRQSLADYLRHQLMGPVDGEYEELTTPPHLEYITGVLHPHRSNSDNLLNQGEQGGAAKVESSEDASYNDDPVRMASEWNPSSLGLTFFCIDTKSIKVSTWGALYSKTLGNQVSNGGILTSETKPSPERREGPNDGTERTWKRYPIATKDEPEILSFHCPSDHTARDIQSCLAGHADIIVHWRTLLQGWLVTVSLVNRKDLPDSEDIKPEPEDCLFQVGIACEPADEGQIVQYPNVKFVSSDPEDEELTVLYRNKQVFAAGHGCAATWDKSSVSSVRRVVSEYLPTFVVPAVTRVTGYETSVTDLAYLADPTTDRSDVIQGLNDFVNAYEAWINNKRGETNVSKSLKDAVNRIFDRLGSAVHRMKASIELLEKHSDHYNGFRLANEAMLRQMRQTAAIHDRNSTSPQAISTSTYRWRPFQLAFFLVVLSSLVNEDDEHRNLVDLIWFPTGGGKTEAYLLVAAFEIISRRKRYGESGEGTAIITRYTLRLLTTQQFQRSATLIAALELMRREGKIPGSGSITIGLWVGAANTPNTYAEAKRIFAEAREQPQPLNHFALETCPWCGTEIFPAEYSDNDGSYGVRADNNCFEFFCPHKDCPFHDKLPIAVVDAHLYREPPTFLLATVDKFARLAWVSEAGVFFGNETIRPPSLIIQDELHLLSGPLGTTVGLYESAIRHLIKMRGVEPKVIASTATIRGAQQQSVGLFGCDVALFPPPGPTEDDSYFAKVDYNSPGRMYMGVMSQTHSSKMTQIHLSAALLHAPVAMEMDNDVLNGYFTQVVYHNTLRELGHSMTLMRDDVVSRLTGRYIESETRPFEDHQIRELTSHIPARELPDILTALERPPENRDDTESIAVLCTTNMISVGVDIGRLGLMAVIGQPKGTAEYIQATSRVGRQEKHPGFVITIYSHSKPRDRSHYEGFTGYHQSLYRHVEPSSVTPFSLPSRNRALHAALVILVRHSISGMQDNRSAGRFDSSDPRVKDIVSLLAQYAAAVDSHDGGATGQQLEKYCREWEQAAKEASRVGKQLQYSGSGKQDVSLLRQFHDTDGLWGTPNSMRSVDVTCSIKVMGE